MKAEKTHVVMLLDESSSMSPHREAVVKSFNEYVESLKGGKRIYLTLAKFSELGIMTPDEGKGAPTLRTVFENRKRKEVHPLTNNQYRPNGMTPLFDAIAGLISQTKERLPKDAKVVFVIHTDGQENRSQKHNQESIKKLIRKCEKKRGWTFVYLGEGAEAWDAGYDFGVSNVSNYSRSRRGESMTKLAAATMCYSNMAGARASKTFYADAGLMPDDIDPDDSPHVTSTVQTDKSDDEPAKDET